jgi:hypothetical protein
MKRVTNYRLTSAVPSNAGKPYLIISNHVSIYDLAYVLLQLKEMPVIVIHEIFQRNPFIARFLRNLGLIWKQADLHEAKSIRQMKRAALAGRSILLYPEGDLSWDGDSAELPPEIVKLVRYIGLPVLSFQEKGAYMTYPRWAASVRRGRVDLSFEQVLDEEDLKVLEDETVLARLRRAFSYSEKDWIRSGEGASVLFDGSKCAAGLSKMLFMCPVCHQMDGLLDSDVTIGCPACGYKANIGLSLGVLDEGLSGVTDIWQWHQKQGIALHEAVNGELKAGSFSREYSLKKAELVRAQGKVNGIVSGGGFNSRRLERPRKLRTDKLEVTASGLRASGKDPSTALYIPISAMKSVRVLPMHIYKPNWLLICTDEGYYKFMFKDATHPAYRISLALREIIRKQGENALLPSGGN